MKTKKDIILKFAKIFYESFFIPGKEINLLFLKLVFAAVIGLLIYGIISTIVI